ncbi:MAG: glycosyltransferase [Lachnospiraceae bacterium]|nr:glycosyltransferase [Lachnospiraceae bacterium]
MLFRIQKKYLGIKYSIDICKYENGIFVIKGWMFSEKNKINNIQILIYADGREYLVDISKDLNRSDVYKELRIEEAKKSGFFGKVRIENVASFDASLVITVNGKKYKNKLGQFVTDEKVVKAVEPKISSIPFGNKEIDLMKLIRETENREWGFPEEYYSQTIDVVVPIYNGYQFFDKLFASISRTKVDYRLIIINDKSPDERVAPYLKNYADKHPEVILLENDENLGFVKSVNKGLKLSDNHVVIVNSDVEVPDMWLERIMAPILEDEKVASSTPYTNCGTIVSFPEIGEDNVLFGGLPLQEIDDEFKKITPKYVAMPTGVGFCMGMSRKAIEDVGLLDADSFGMGYGEENDWCQRAIDKGYKNVHVENLFVYHNHGGSFLSEDKKRYLEEHARILEEKHPDYNRQVARFFDVDENKEIRKIVKYLLLRKSKVKETIVAFDHDLGGGATSYLIKKRHQLIEQGYAFYVIKYNYVQNYYQILFQCADDKAQFFVRNQSDIFTALEFLNVDEIWINELVTYPDLFSVLEKLEKFVREKNVKLKMLLHDYFAVCPTINLLNVDEKYCGVPDECSQCAECFRNVHPAYEKDYGSMEIWREKWKNFLKSCSSIVVFSNDSKKILQKVYGELPNIEVVPHQIGYMPRIQKKYKTTDSFNIGLLGVLTKHKGADIVRELTAEIEKRGLNIRVVLIGFSSEKIESPVFFETGKYSSDSIPRLTLKHDIDMFLIPSIWPETFSYTAEEIMKMGMPLMCFDIGAPAERIVDYEKGNIIPEISGKAALGAVLNSGYIQKANELERKTDKVLFVSGEDSFASRYRVEHLREQLLFKGIASKRIKAAQIDKCDVSEFHSVVIYRVADDARIMRLVKRAHKQGVKVYCDIDDYIFEYDKIRHLSFLQGKDYKEFESYSKSIKKTMELCDGYIVSTQTMLEGVRDSFPEKPVYINRNVASMAMQICSLRTEPVVKDHKIYLGYFSGTKTHNKDFEQIKEALLRIMTENERVYLLAGGQIKLPEEFNVFKGRVERFDMIIWRKLPRLIARADINLMPLEDTFFHACKSENKWMEAALVHVPTVASRNEELERVIKNGEDGFLCRNTEEWYEVIKKLVEDKELRKQIGEAAYQRVLKEYTTATVEPDVVDALIHC